MFRKVQLLDFFCYNKNKEGDNMILEEFDECKTSTFDPYEVENVIPNFPKIGTAAVNLPQFVSFHSAIQSNMAMLFQI